MKCKDENRKHTYTRERNTFHLMYGMWLDRMKWLTHDFFSVAKRHFVAFASHPLSEREREGEKEKSLKLNMTKIMFRQTLLYHIKMSKETQTISHKMQTGTPSSQRPKWCIKKADEITMKVVADREKKWTGPKYLNSSQILFYFLFLRFVLRLLFFAAYFCHELYVFVLCNVKKKKQFLSSIFICFSERESLVVCRNSFFFVVLCLISFVRLKIFFFTASHEKFNFLASAYQQVDMDTSYISNQFCGFIVV